MFYIALYRFVISTGSRYSNGSFPPQDELYAALPSDMLDSFGYPDQALRPFVRPLDETQNLFGRARTGLYMNTYSVAEGERNASANT